MARRRTVRRNGYVDVYLPEHPLARRSGYVGEHRLVAWDAGLFTDPTWDVHHRNGDRHDNRAENLEALPHDVHTQLHSDIGAWQRAKTHCPAGHPYSAENTTRRARGGRICRTCRRARDRAARAKLRAERDDAVALFRREVDVPAPEPLCRCAAAAPR